MRVDKVKCKKMEVEQTKISGNGKIVQRPGRMKGNVLSEILEKITINISDYY